MLLVSLCVNWTMNLSLSLFSNFLNYLTTENLTSSFFLTWWAQLAHFHHFFSLVNAHFHFCILGQRPLQIVDAVVEQPVNLFHKETSSLFLVFFSQQGLFFLSTFSTTGLTWAIYIWSKLAQFIILVIGPKLASFPSKWADILLYWPQTCSFLFPIFVLQLLLTRVWTGPI